MLRATFGLRAVSSLAVALVMAAGAAADIGYADLVTRLGGVGVPTGAGVGAAQVEAPISGNYGPDQTSSEFAGVAFTAMSGPPGNSWHATLVAEGMYGNTLSIAPGLDSVWLYEASNFVFTGYLRTGQGGAAVPFLPPGNVRIFNNAWIGSAGMTSDNDANRRADFAMHRDGTLFVAGLNNGPGSVPALMNFQFNGLSVGLENGNHSWGTVPAGADAPGRMKPEIVAPSTATSYATGIVSSVAALLYETANTPPLSSNPDAARGVVIKSVMMAGTKRRASWSNLPDTSGPNRGVTVKPLDPVYGADTVNVNLAHWILTAGEQDGQTSVPSTPNIGSRGWDYRTMAAGNVAYWRFKVSQPVEDVRILVTWNRSFLSTVNAGVQANMELTLWRVEPGSTTLLPLTGDAGIPYFTNGNVASKSPVDNVEHLYLRDLAAGQYVIEVKRLDAGSLAVPTALAWLMPETPQCAIGDFNCDDIIDGNDLGTLLGQWGVCDGCPADLNDDGVVDGDDLGTLLGVWGPVS